ncbi:MAG: PTS sugar transporter subunit IIA [Fibrobacter sp.]|nr:PTS sugar transporter subunit IIA [Fibrobacter sp.]
MIPVYTKFYNEPTAFAKALGFAYDALVHSGVAFDANDAWKTLAERVKQGIYMGDGLLLPHTRIAGLERPLMAFCVCPAGFTDVEIRGGEKAQFMCVLLSPAESAMAHTQAIAGMAKLILDSEWKARALAVADDAAVKQLFI